jgi:hypothetical protein
MICERWVSTVLMLRPRPLAISRVDLPPHDQPQNFQLACRQIMGVGDFRLFLWVRINAWLITVWAIAGLR